ncbi:MAG: 2-oxoacid:acceptor oxidoreductase family protein [Rhodospirillales bacterium]|jgi:pyruvate ferredoxin oxidoreductase gamma subunit|nr:2-oxoacid:acceptor oxidoreductase family protein [Rhodospirillales bacterium]
MVEIRIHGRGGQGNAVAAYLLATAAFEDGQHCQAFPTFGAERRGAPVTAFVRVSDRPILRRNQVVHPAHLIIQDESLLHDEGLTSGLLPGGGILVNSTASSEEISAAQGQPIVALPATAMAIETVGRPVPNVALLSAFLTLTGLLSHKALSKALAERFKGDVLKNNLKLVKLAAVGVPAGEWAEAGHAPGA